VGSVITQEGGSRGESEDMNTREWRLDLTEIALGVRDEEGQTSTLFATIHAMVTNHDQQEDYGSRG